MAQQKKKSSNVSKKKTGSQSAAQRAKNQRAHLRRLRIEQHEQKGKCSQSETRRFAYVG